ncbi:copper chaperone PCu(A)C [Desertimonas flava]|uniref:copper chaperone PCu(A)C n=1 Tax=Desertimonas flava TaxID=2064846 RepID=UPI000E344031|nr:copper chaperone PCu(A)C [Desertimonas flava]
MTFRRLLPLAVLLPVVVACGDDDGSGDATPAVEITDAWARTTPPGTTVGAVYFVAESTTDDAIVSVTVDPAVAGSVELHQMAPAAGDVDADADVNDNDNAMMSMQQVARLDLPAGEALDVDAAGYHVMLVELAGSLVTGDEFDLELGFEHAPAQSITVEVREFAPGDD